MSADPLLPVLMACEALSVAQDLVAEAEHGEVVDQALAARAEAACQEGLTDALCEWLHDEQGVTWNPLPTPFTTHMTSREVLP